MAVPDLLLQGHPGLAGRPHEEGGAGDVHNGAGLADPGALLVGEGKAVRMANFATAADVAARRGDLLALIKAWMRLKDRRPGAAAAAIPSARALRSQGADERLTSTRAGKPAARRSSRSA